jgi:hypothetical protein
VAAIFIEFDIAQYDDVLASFFDSDKSEQCAFSILLLLKNFCIAFGSEKRIKRKDEMCIHPNIPCFN